MNVCVRRTYIGRSFIHSLIDWGGGRIVCQGSSKAWIISSISIYQWWQQLYLYNLLLPTVVVIVIVSIPSSVSFKCKLLIFSYNKLLVQCLFSPCLLNEMIPKCVYVCMRALDMYLIIGHADPLHSGCSLLFATIICTKITSHWFCIRSSQNQPFFFPG